MNHTGFPPIIRLVFAMLMALSVTVVMSAQTTSAKHTTKKKSTTATAKASDGAAASTSTPGQRVFIDPVTHKPYQPSPEEIKALESSGKKGMTKSAKAQRSIQHPSGAVGMTVPEESMSYAVATKGPDGKVSFACVDEKAKAEKMVKSGAVATSAKEVRNDK